MHLARRLSLLQSSLALKLHQASSREWGRVANKVSTYATTTCRDDVHVAYPGHALANVHVVSFSLSALQQGHCMCSIVIKFRLSVLAVSCARAAVDGAKCSLLNVNCFVMCHQLSPQRLLSFPSL